MLLHFDIESFTRGLSTQSVPLQMKLSGMINVFMSPDIAYMQSSELYSEDDLWRHLMLFPRPEAINHKRLWTVVKRLFTNTHT